MKLFLTNETPILLEPSELWYGTDKDVYRFKRKFTVPISPRLQFHEGEPSSEWNLPGKILAGVSWNARIQLRIKQVTTTNDDTHMANVLYVDGDNAAGEFQKLSYLFQGPSLGDVKMSVQLGNSVTINFNKGLWGEPEELEDFKSESRHSSRYDVQLSNEQALALYNAEDKDIRVTQEIDFGTLNA